MLQFQSSGSGASGAVELDDGEKGVPVDDVLGELQGDSEEHLLGFGLAVEALIVVIVQPVSFLHGNFPSCNPAMIV